MEKTTKEIEIAAILKALPKEFRDSDAHAQAVLNTRGTIAEHSEFSGDYEDNPEMMATNLDFQIFSGNYDVPARIVTIWKEADKKITAIQRGAK